MTNDRTGTSEASEPTTATLLLCALRDRPGEWLTLSSLGQATGVPVTDLLNAILTLKRLRLMRVRRTAGGARLTFQVSDKGREHTPEPA
jgi:hypothetical protein